MQRRTTRPTMKRKKKTSSIPLRKIYFFIVGLIFLVSLLVSWLGSSKKPSVDDSVPTGYKSALKRHGEITLYRNRNELPDDENKRLHKQQLILMKVSSYEMYLPFSVIYEKAQNELVDNQEYIYIREELTDFASRVRERFSETINDPTDETLRDLAQYMRSMRPEIIQLIRKIESAPDGMTQKARQKIITNLEKLLRVVDEMKTN